MTTPKILPLNLYESQAVLLAASPPILNQNWSFESGNLAPWTVNNNAQASVSNLWSFQGTNSMLFTGDGITATPTMFSEFIPVKPNTNYTASFELYSPQGSPSNVVRLIYYNSSFVNVGQFTNFPAPVPANVPAGTLQAISGLSPATAVWAQFLIQMEGTPPVTQQMFADLAQLNPGGTPSNGLGSGVAQLTPFGARNGGLSWTPSQAQVRVDTNSLEAQCILYVSYGIQAYGLPDIVGVTESGSTGATAAMAGQTLRPGDWVTAAWSGGDPGSYAHLLLTGSIQTPGG